MTAFYSWSEIKLVLAKPRGGGYQVPLVTLNNRESRVQRTTITNEFANHVDLIKNVNLAVNLAIVQFHQVIYSNG